MDLDAFAAEHGAHWNRLRVLLERPRRKLSAAEVDELVMLYRRTATHLSIVRSRSPDPQLIAMLSRLVLRARAAVTPAAPTSWRTPLRFLTVAFPLEMYRAGGWIAAVGLAFVAFSGVLMAIVVNDPTVATHFMTPQEIEQLVEEDFEAYYSSSPPQNFGFAVWTNNAWVSAICLAAGVIILPTVYILGVNALNLGLVGGVMIGYGSAELFFGLLLVHGLLELTCIFVAAGVGLRIGWAWIAPGPLLTRAQSVAVAGRSGVVVAGGLVPVLLVSGLVEAFVTPAPLPPPLKLAVGALIWLAFLAYVAVLGALADWAGLRDADVDQPDREAYAPAV